MSQPYVGEVRLVGFNFAPYGWFTCQGQTLPISEYETLYNLIGTTYGGDGQTTFNVPDLQGRTPIHMGTGSTGTAYPIGQLLGVEQVTLTSNNYPSHTHPFIASQNSNGATSTPGNNTVSAGLEVFSNKTPTSNMAAGMVSTAPGSSLPHENRQPYLVLNWIIALYGVYPTPN